MVYRCYFRPPGIYIGLCDNYNHMTADYVRYLDMAFDILTPFISINEMEDASQGLPGVLHDGTYDI